MIDDKTNSGRLDHDVVSLDEPWRVHYWTTKLKCTAELRAAIAEVGPAVVKIRAYLTKT